MDIAWLERCREAIPSKEKGGKVITIDMIMMKNQKGDCKSRETQLFFDMLMMVLVMGREREEKEWKKLFLDAGFSHYKNTHARFEVAHHGLSLMLYL